MTANRIAAAVALLTLATAGCGAETPDYQSIWSSSTSATTTTKPVPVSEYLEGAGVTGEPLMRSALTDLTVSISPPPGWESTSNPKSAPGVEVILKKDVAGGQYQAGATLMVFKLNGDFDVAETIRHGNAGAELSEAFVRLDASTENFDGFPSSMTEGTYTRDGQRLYSWNRIVIATGSPPADQRYLVQLTVTTAADQAKPLGPQVEALINSFTVAAK